MPEVSDITIDNTYMEPFGGPYILPVDRTTDEDWQLVAWRMELYRAVSGRWTIEHWPGTSIPLVTPWAGPYWVRDNETDNYNTGNGWPISNAGMLAQRFLLDGEQDAGLYRVAFKVHWYPTASPQIPAYERTWFASEHRNGSFGSSPFVMQYCDYPSRYNITVQGPFSH